MIQLENTKAPPLEMQENQVVIQNLALLPSYKFKTTQILEQI
jgi:hypothetical protein